MKLYHWPNTRSFRPLWLLEELGIDYELELIDIFSGNRDKHYLQINPNGTLPTLDDDGFILYEAGAICMYLTDKFPEQQLAPAINSAARGRYYQWMFFVAATLEQPLWQILYHSKLLPEEKRLPQVVKYSRWFFERAANTLNLELENRKFIVGDQFTTADIMLASTLQWFPEFNEAYPAIMDYCRRLTARPAYQRAKEK